METHSQMHPTVVQRRAARARDAVASVDLARLTGRADVAAFSWRPLFRFASPVAADEYDQEAAGHPLRIVAYILHPVGRRDRLSGLPPGALARQHEPMQTVVGHDETDWRTCARAWAPGRRAGRFRPASRGTRRRVAASELLRRSASLRTLAVGHRPVCALRRAFDVPRPRHVGSAHRGSPARCSTSRRHDLRGERGLRQRDRVALRDARPLLSGARRRGSRRR